MQKTAKILKAQAWQLMYILPSQTRQMLLNIVTTWKNLQPLPPPTNNQNRPLPLIMLQFLLKIPVKNWLVIRSSSFHW